jgi:hypothetical protein
MGHHYVPRFYLRGFESEGAIWTFDKKSGNVFPSQAKSIANETGMYSDELESYLAREIEGPAIPALSKIRAREYLSDSDRVALARYIVTLWKRVPKARQRAIELMPEVATKVQQSMTSDLESLVKQDPSKRFQVEELKQHVAEIIARHKATPPPAVWHHSIRSESGPRIVEATLSMNWTFLVSETNQFLSGDNPVFFFEHEGIGKPTSEISIPFSSTVALWASRGPAPNGQYLKALPSAVKEINRRTAHNSVRFVYASRNEAWIKPFLDRDSWRLTRLRFGNA